MLVQLSDALPCETLKSPAVSCNRPARIGMLKLLETMADVNYVMTPICPTCIALLATAAGQATQPREAIEATTIKQVLATRLGLEGADEVLCALRAAVSNAEGDDGDD